MNQTEIPTQCISPSSLGIRSHGPSSGKPPLSPACHPSRLGLALCDPSADHSGLSEAVSVTAVSLAPTSARLDTKECVIAK